MARYINLEDPMVYVGGYTPDGYTVFHVPSNTPTADVRENVHAHWDIVEVKKGEWWHTCSKCKATWGSDDGELDFNFCPNCGADMRERREDGTKQD